MTRIFVFLTFLCCYSFGFSQSLRDSVMLPINDYMIGTSYNHVDQIKRAFHDSTLLFLDDRDGRPLIISAEKYSGFFGGRTPGEFNGRYATLQRLDIYQNIAYAEIEIKSPQHNSRYIDLMLLKKMPDGWKIIGKTATGYTLSDSDNAPQKVDVMTGLHQPWSMAFIDEERAIVSELSGDLLLVDLNVGSREVISGFPEDLFEPFVLEVSRYPEGTYPAPADGREVRFNAGILEVVLDPDFEKNQKVYVSYVSQQEDRFALKVISATLDDIRLTDIKTLLNPGPYVPGLFHFGGGMTFGRDGMLYITVGERLFAEGLKTGLPIAQDIKDARGKIYRIYPDGSIPEDNPDFGPEAIPGLYAIGIRAAQGITVHPEDGSIWFSEHGTTQGDELNLLIPGANYGWPDRTTGGYRTPNYEAPVREGVEYTDPVHFWLQTVAPTGLTHYTGYARPEWYGDLIVPGLSRGSLWRLDMQDDRVRAVEELFVDDRVRLRKAVMSPDGRLYLLTDEANGRIIRVD